MPQWVKDLGAWLAGLNTGVQITAFVCVAVAVVVALLVRFDVGGLFNSLPGK